jgi:hypothetical protein
MQIRSFQFDKTTDLVWNLYLHNTNKIRQNNKKITVKYHEKRKKWEVKSGKHGGIP